jgi:Ca2+-binding RTX toxin-like protein
MHFNIFRNIQFSLFFLALLSSLSFITNGGIIVTNDVWASHGGDFDTDDIDRDYDEDDTQNIGGLHIIRGDKFIVGTDEDDFIIGGFDPDTVIAKEGDDEVQTHTGIDQLYGGDGKDTLQGGLDNDQLFGQAGSDNLVGGLDDDLMVGGSGDDHLFGSFGDDQLKGGSGADYFNCGADVDEVKDYDPSHGDIIETNCEIINTD